MEKINFHNKRFRAISNTDNGEVDGQTFFHYRQGGDVIWATYHGPSIRMGTLTGVIKNDGTLEFNYQHVNLQHEIMTGFCKSTPFTDESGTLHLKEEWQWTSGDLSKGTSELIEMVEKDNLNPIF
ncbi:MULTISPECIES: n-acetylglutamate synthase [Flammeovirga]|uniref:N-acetylglutamate synthase n=1 Tax=Flammeovirga agarivorans TaxID=2726742 RepID=A0A7X8XU09_9BACT|nr:MULTISPECIES: n-acetylglutamate synthase [Flammeovirga]NLR89927.1 n-acetylglutamate synthase [Flammeovirga agarivorans]